MHRITRHNVTPLLMKPVSSSSKINIVDRTIPTSSWHFSRPRLDDNNALYRMR